MPQFIFAYFCYSIDFLVLFLRNISTGSKPCSLQLPHSRRRPAANKTIFATEHQGMSQRTKATTTRAVSKEEASAAVDNFAELLKRSSKDYGLAMSAAEVKTRILEWLDRTECFDAEAILIVSKVYGIMTKDKRGNAKSFNETLHFMRRCADFRETVMRNKRDTATERVLDADDVSACYRACGQDLLQNDLFPNQLKDRKYQLRWDDSGDPILTSFQTSFVGNILRKRLGDKKLAFHIWQHGLPKLIAPPLLQSRAPSPTKALEQCCHWYTAFGQSLAAYEASPALPEQRALGGTCKGWKLDQDQDTRRKLLAVAKTALAEGRKLANAMGVGKRKWNEMTPDEQKNLEEYETRKSTKAIDDLKIAPPDKFRSEARLQSVLEKGSTVRATEHPKKRQPTRWNTPQGTERATERPGMNIIFVNIDWKRSRHESDAAERRNLQQLAGTVDSIVSQLRPAVVCFCEFGEVAQPLYAAHVEVLKNEVQENWRQAVRWRNVNAT